MGDGKGTNGENYHPQNDQPNLLPGTPARVRHESVPEQPSWQTFQFSPGDRNSRRSSLSRTTTAPMGEINRTITSQKRAQESKLPRTTTLATLVQGSDPTWPQWFADAKASYPALMDSELRSLREMFETHAVRGSDGTQSISLSGVAKILDEGFKHVFSQLDADHSGKLERNEIETLVNTLGRQMAGPEFDAMMKELDADNSGDVSFEEFRQWWDAQQYQHAAEREMELQDMFDIVDIDASGEVDWGEFLTMIGSQLSTDTSFATATRQPEQAGVLVITALECVRADVRAIYGRNSRGKTRLRLLNHAEIEARRKRCFFTPDSTFRKIWDLVQALMLFYVALAVPLRIGFDITAKLGTFMFYFELCVDIYFYIDIGVNFRSAYRNGDKELIVDTKEIRALYMRTWFPIDVLSCLPVNYIELAIKTGKGQQDVGSDQNFKLFKVLRLLRLAKLLRLARINRLLQRLESEYEGVAAAVKVQKIMLTIIFVAHMVACFWYYVGTETRLVVGKTTRETHPDEDEGIELYEVFGAGDSISDPGGILEGWVVKNGWDLDPDFKEISLWTRYLDAFYFSVTTLTTVGFGDRTPFTNAEKAFSILAELAGSIIFGIIAGSMGALAMSTKMSEREIRFEQERLDEFLKLKRISKGLRRQVNQQMDNWFETKSVFDEQTILDKLPPKHRKELLMEMYRDHLAACPLLKDMEEGILSKLCLKMSPYLALADDLIVKEGDVGEEMYMVVRGCVRLSSTSFGKYNDRNWEDGAFFGEMTILGIGGGPEANRHVYSAAAVIDSDCIFITHKILSDFQIMYPTFKHRMRSMALKRARRFGYGITPNTAEDGITPNAAEDFTDHLDASMNVALESAERRSRASSSVMDSNARVSHHRESRQLLNLPSKSESQDVGIDHTVSGASSHLQRELITEISASSRAPSSGLTRSGLKTASADDDEVRLLREEVRELSRLLKQTLVAQKEQGEPLTPSRSVKLPSIPPQPDSPPAMGAPLPATLSTPSPNNDVSPADPEQLARSLKSQRTPQP